MSVSFNPGFPPSQPAGIPTGAIPQQPAPANIGMPSTGFPEANAPMSLPQVSTPPAADSFQPQQAAPSMPPSAPAAVGPNTGAAPGAGVPSDAEIQAMLNSIMGGAGGAPGAGAGSIPGAGAPTAPAGMPAGTGQVSQMPDGTVQEANGAPATAGATGTGKSLINPKILMAATAAVGVGVALLLRKKEAVVDITEKVGQTLAPDQIKETEKALASLKGLPEELKAAQQAENATEAIGGIQGKSQETIDNINHWGKWECIAKDEANAFHGAMAELKDTHQTLLTKAADTAESLTDEVIKPFESAVDKVKAALDKTFSEVKTETAA